MDRWLTETERRCPRCRVVTPHHRDGDLGALVCSECAAKRLVAGGRAGDTSPQPDQPHPPMPYLHDARTRGWLRYMRHLYRSGTLNDD